MFFGGVPMRRFVWRNRTISSPSDYEESMEFARLTPEQLKYKKIAAEEMYYKSDKLYRRSVSPKGWAELLVIALLITFAVALATKSVLAGVAVFAVVLVAKLLYCQKLKASASQAKDSLDEILDKSKTIIRPSSFTSTDKPLSPDKDFYFDLPPVKKERRYEFHLDDSPKKDSADTTDHSDKSVTEEEIKSDLKTVNASGETEDVFEDDSEELLAEVLEELREAAIALST